MNRMTLKVQKLWGQTQRWSKDFAPRLELLIDKYKLIKVGCILGIAVNGYFIYDGVLDIIVLRGVKKEVEERKDFFYKRVEHKRDQVLALIQELQKEDSSKASSKVV